MQFTLFNVEQNISLKEAVRLVAKFASRVLHLDEDIVVWVFVTQKFIDNWRLSYESLRDAYMKKWPVIS